MSLDDWDAWVIVWSMDDEFLLCAWMIVMCTDYCIVMEESLSNMHGCYGFSKDDY